MAGRGRGRGIYRWDQAPGFVSDGRAVASVPPLKKQIPPSAQMDSHNSKLSSVRVTCIIDVNHFWAQLGSDSELEHFDSYMFALNHWCDNQLQSAVSEMPNVGQVVCVRHAATRMWRRAEVTRLCQRMVDVFFLDYGEAECVPLDMLCNHVPEDITSWPPQALYCTLSGIQPPEGEEQWSEKAMKRFKELVNGGQTLAASHDNGSFQLILYIVDESGQRKSLGSILIEEGLAKETSSNHESSGDNMWPEAPQRSYEPDKKGPENSAFKNLDKLEQQLVMSGFSYLIAPSGNLESKPRNEFAYESTTTSSTFSSYKKAPQTMSSSGAFQNFTPVSENTIGSRSQQVHVSNRPHLASPGEFMATAKLSSLVKEPGSSILEEDNAAVFGPPGSKRTSTTNSSNDYGQKSPWYYSNSSLVSNAWSPSEQHFPNDWQLPGNDQSNDKSLVYGSRDMFYSEEQTSLANALQYHLDGPSAFHEPKFKQQNPITSFNMPFTSQNEESSIKQPGIKNQRQESRAQQPSILQQQNTQKTQDNSQEKTMQTELSWQKWKFQRNVKRILDKHPTSDEEIQHLGIELGMIIKNSKLSQNFEGISEVMMVLELITEQVLDRKGFAFQAAKMCHILSGLEIAQFTRYLCKVANAIREDIVEHLTVSDWQQRYNRFCCFIGKMILIAVSDECSNKSFKSAVDILASQSLENWMKFDQSKSERELEGFVVCLTSLLRVITPIMEEQKLSFGNLNSATIFSSLRDHVLSENLPRSIKSSLLDLLLLKASGWPEEPERITEDEETGTNLELDQGKENEILEKEIEEWDPYGKICAMLKKLKLEDLFKKFKDNRIRDTLLVANKEDFKTTLQEAGFPPGVILEIQMFLEKGEELTARKKNPLNNTKDPKGVSNIPRILPTTTSSKEQSLAKNKVEEEPCVNTGEDRELVKQADNLEKSWQSQVIPPRSISDHTNVETIEASYPNSNKMPEERRPTHDDNVEESKSSIIDAHNLFEPSYLSRPPPLRVDASAFEYDPEQDSPSNHGPMSYSAVLKVKNEESAAETQPKSMPVKLTSLTKGNESVKELNQVPNKQQLQKYPTKDTSKESSGSRRDQPSGPRPPPGLPPLPPKNWGQSPELRLTVLQTRRGKTENTPTVGPPSEGDTSLWKGRQGFGSPQDSRTFTGRGGAASRGRLENRTGFRGGNENLPLQSRTGPLPWRRLESEAQDVKNAGRGDEHVIRPFGPGGPKACFNCGSKNHLTCSDRSKMFFD